MQVNKFFSSDLHVYTDACGWVGHRSCNPPYWKEKHSIITKNLWLSGNTKDTPFFTLRNSAVLWTVMTFKKKTVAKDNYKLSEKLQLQSALTPFFVLFT